METAVKNSLLKFLVFQLVFFGWLGVPFAQKTVVYETFNDISSDSLWLAWYAGDPDVLAKISVGSNIDSLHELNNQSHPMDTTGHQDYSPPNNIPLVRFGSDYAARFSGDQAFRIRGVSSELTPFHNDSVAFFMVFKMPDGLDDAGQFYFTNQEVSVNKVGTVYRADSDTSMFLQVANGSGTYVIRIDPTTKLKPDSLNYIWLFFEDRGDADASRAITNGVVETFTKTAENPSSSISQFNPYLGTRYLSAFLRQSVNELDGDVGCIFVFDNENWPSDYMIEQLQITAQYVYGDSLNIYPEGVQFGSGEGEGGGEQTSQQNINRGTAWGGSRNPWGNNK